MRINPHTLISQYNGVKDNIGTDCTIISVVNRINANSVIKKQIEKLRASEGKEKEALKKKLMGFTWSGKFEKRKADALIEYSNLICLDFDKLPDVEATKQLIISQAPKFLYALFISPSGNGLKAICYVQGGVEQHLNNFNTLKGFFNKVFHLQVDESGKDVNRLCFISSDSNIYINEDAEAFENKLIEIETKEVKEEKPKAKTKPTNYQTELESLVAFTEKKEAYTVGNRNKFLHLFACNANRKGIPLNECLSFCQTQFDKFSDAPKESIETIKSAYKHNAHEFGKYTESWKQKKTVAAINKELNIVDDSVKFWYYEKTKEKNEDGQPILKLRFSYRDIRIFLANNGFYRYDVKGGYEFVRVEGFLIEFTNEVKIRDFIYNYIESAELHDVDEMLTRAVNKYLSSNIFERLPYLNNKKENTVSIDNPQIKLEV